MQHTTAPWSVVVPVKRAELAKTRLAEVAGRYRPDLARAFAADTVAATLACPSVSQVVVVTDDEPAAVELGKSGAIVVNDAPDAGINAALRHGAEVARQRWPGHGLVGLSADLPALRPDELATALRIAAAHSLCFVSDLAGIGTTLYAAQPTVTFDPRFGNRSRAAHRVAGAVEVDRADIPSLRRDVDTPVDLWDALRLGVGPRTASVSAKLTN